MLLKQNEPKNLKIFLQKFLERIFLMSRRDFYFLMYSYHGRYKTLRMMS